MRLSAILFLFLACISTAYAAVLPTSSVFISIGATPEYPKPNQTVTLKGYVSGVKGQYTFVWEANGEEIVRGVDLDTIAIAVGGAGSATTIRLSVLNPSGETRGEALYTIRPASVDLVWEGNTYVPSWYRGTPYPNGESTILVEAIPYFASGGALIPKHELVYTWEADGKKLTAQSGYGKSSLAVKPTSFQNTTNVTVVVKARDGAVSGQTRASIPIRDPLLAIYESRPLLGLWSGRAIRGTYALTSEEVTLRAFPFFVTNPSILSYSWTTGQNDTTISKKAEATFRNSGAESGIVPMTVTVEKQNSLFERATNTFQLSF